MYKAIQADTGEEIIILQPAWLRRIQQLRELDHADRLVCQGCQQPLRVKAGEVKRPHFAHKHLKACSFGSESPEILHARAVLYGWLLARFGASAGLEKALPGLPRPVDGWVESGGKDMPVGNDMPGGGFAYWIIEAGIKLETRQAIQAVFAPFGDRAHIVFLASMLNEEQTAFPNLLLTPTERTFMQTGPVDRVLAGPSGAGASLHYLDVDRPALITYRALALRHSPNVFSGVKKTTPLAAVQAGRADGDFLHPGEFKQLRSYEQRRERLEQKRQAYQQRADPPAPAASWGAVTLPEEVPPPTDPPLPCATCGQITSDYWSTFLDERGRRLCRCRECLQAGLGN